MLEYFVGEYGIFIFLIQKKNVEIFEIKKDFPLETWINQMLEKGICQATNVSNYRKSIPIYAKAAQKLYEKLIPETLAEKLTDELIILPDGVLGFVPFEALLTKLPEDFYSWKKYDFFIREHQISYIYSATLLEVMQEKKLPAQKNMTLLAMAPFPEKNASDRPSESPSSSRKGESFKPLKHSTTECQEVSKLFGGDFYIGKEANKNRFRKEAENYRILHISTHAKANFEVSDFAFLAFGYQHSEEEVEKLYSKDLYNFQLNAEMVVLSACETGIGTAKKGEGIISLARAFSYAGAKSVFATLWQVDDEKTKDLVINFYANLKKGWRKDEALYEAKKTSLENEDNAHPYFWAGLIGIGDMREIE